MRRGKNMPRECCRKAKKATPAETQWINTEVAKHQRKIWYHISANKNKTSFTDWFPIMAMAMCNYLGKKKCFLHVTPYSSGKPQCWYRVEGNLSKTLRPSNEHCAFRRSVFFFGLHVHDSKVYCLTMLNSMQCIMAKTGSLMGDVTFV